MLDFLDPAMMGKILAVLGMLSGLRVLIDAFGNKDNSFNKYFGKVVDFFSANIAHK